MSNLVDFNGKEYLVVKVRGRLKHSRMLSEIIKRGDILLSDITSGATHVMKCPDFDNNLLIHRHRGDKYIRIPMDASCAYDKLAFEIRNGYMTSYLARRYPDGAVRRVFASEILSSTVKVKKKIKRLIDGL